MINIDARIENADWPKRIPDTFSDLVRKFDPNQPRDDQGQWVTLYHGTRAKHLPSIFKEGLRPSKEGLVWATESQEEAQQFAKGLEYPNPTPDATVVEIHAPKSAFFFEKSLTPGKKIPVGQRTARFAGGVRPEWLIRKYDPHQLRTPKGTSEGGRFAGRHSQYHTSAAKMQQEPLPPNLILAEERIRYEELEHLFLVRDGKPFKVMGNDDPHHVYMNDATSEDFKDAVLTHNHPSGFGLSNRDGMTAAEKNLLEIRAVTATGTHSIRRTGPNWPLSFLDEIQVIDTEIKAQLGPLVASKKMPASVANEAHHIRLYQMLQKRVGGFVYSFEPIKP